MFRIFLGALILYPTLSTAALAYCSAGLDLFTSCQIAERGTEVSVCFDSERVEYNYGPIGETPELKLTDTILNAEYVPWSGIGRAIWEYTVFRNGEYAYEVGAGFDRPFSEEEQMSDEEQRFGWISITQNGEELKRLECIPDTVSYAFGAGIYDQKTAAGLTWDLSEEKWFWDTEHFEEAARNIQPILTTETFNGSHDCMPRSEFAFSGVQLLGNVDTFSDRFPSLQTRLSSGVDIVQEWFAHNGLEVFVGDDQMHELIATKPDWVTPSGLHVGMSRAQVVNILGRLPKYPVEAMQSFAFPGCFVDEVLIQWSFDIQFDADQYVNRIELRSQY
ncbi:hypothetical protein [Loktanella sp. R86503]|uniref:hypothetical protein n=1 Tax=Loktanella sp. R86503 TaxID=3093847 RepID=UPI0036DD2DE0